MNKDQYDVLSFKEKIFADLLVELSERMRRLADLMDRELHD